MNKLIEVKGCMDCPFVKGSYCTWEIQGKVIPIGSYILYSGQSHPSNCPLKSNPITIKLKE